MGKIQMQNRFNALRLRATAAHAMHDWSALEATLSKQLALSKSNPVLYSTRSLANRRLRKVAQASRDADVIISLEPYSPHGYYRRAEARLSENKLSEAASDLIASMERNGLPGPAVDCSGFIDLERPRAEGDYRDSIESSLPCSLFGDVLGRIRRGRSFYQHAPRPNRLPEVCASRLSPVTHSVKSCSLCRHSPALPWRRRLTRSHTLVPTLICLCHAVFRHAIYAPARPLRCTAHWPRPDGTCNDRCWANGECQQAGCPGHTAADQPHKTSTGSIACLGGRSG